MTVVLLCGAGLLVRTVVALNGANSGFEKQDVLTMEVALPAARYTAEQRDGVLPRGGGRTCGRFRACRPLRPPQPPRNRVADGGGTSSIVSARPSCR